MKNKILVVLAGSLFLAGCSSSSTTSIDQVNPTSTPSPVVTDLKAGGSSYLDPKGAFSFLYPNDYVLDTKDSMHPRIYKRGATERPQSEMTDGVLMVFESIDLKGKSLEEEVDGRIKASSDAGTADVVQPKKAITLNNHPGFSYEAKGLGSSIYLFLQKDTKSKNAVLITYVVNDPQSKGYQSEVDAILKTVELH